MTMRRWKALEVLQPHNRQAQELVLERGCMMEVSNPPFSCTQPLRCGRACDAPTRLEGEEVQISMVVLGSATATDCQRNPIQHRRDNRQRVRATGLVEALTVALCQNGRSIGSACNGSCMPSAAVCALGTGVIAVCN